MRQGSPNTCTSHNTHAPRLPRHQSHTAIFIPNHRDELPPELPREIDSFPFLKPALRVHPLRIRFCHFIIGVHCGLLRLKCEKRERLPSPLSSLRPCAVTSTCA